ncbi:hypothetical protein JQX13_51220 [Archangium violaceum]|uniref:hypothetical protein n=1 Tax=Archangium violaceum TaxID=83451 RepID=UPI00193BCF04|nr:hypothetical protein [Archangium violaceum]QRK08213.1 hypothetical protein JQX13_51220 [Archangium violaceum]
MNTASRPHGRRRGAALVETALLMLVLIPLLLYAIFLMDAAYMKLDLQETVVSGLWDFSTRNREAGKKDNERLDELALTSRAVRATYSDHTSAFDDGAEVDAPGYGDTSRIRGNHDHQKHHKIYFAAQYTFRFDANVGPDTQFKCTVKEDSSWANDVTNVLPTFANSRYNAGGQVVCEATGYIYNYLLPEKLFTEFTEVKMSDLTKRGTGSDSHAYQGQGNNIIAKERGSLFFNTWALRTGSETGRLDEKTDIGAREGGGDPQNVEGPFYDRVVATYSDIPSYAAVTAASANFTSKAMSTDLMTAVTAGARTREVAGLPNMAGTFLVARYKPQSPGQKQQSPQDFIGGKGYQSTPYSGVNNKYVNAYNKRGVHYMGCKQAEKDKCP